MLKKSGRKTESCGTPKKDFTPVTKKCVDFCSSISAIQIIVNDFKAIFIKLVIYSMKSFGQIY